MFSSSYFQQKLYLPGKMQLPLALGLLTHQSSLALVHWCRESQMWLIPVYSCFPSSEIHHTEISYQDIWPYLYFQTFTAWSLCPFPSYRYGNGLKILDDETDLHCGFLLWKVKLVQEQVSLEHAQVKLSCPTKYMKYFQFSIFLVRILLLIICRRN